jgi:F-type H+-transporting ATPase subunit delta
MADLRVARRYATALFGVAIQSDALDSVHSDLLAVRQLWEENPSLSAVMSRPQTSLEVKDRIWTQLLENNVGSLMIRFVRLLTDKRRISLLPEISDEFQRLADQHRNLVRATVTTAAPLPSDQAEALKASLTTKTGRNVEMDLHVDPALIGGVIVRIGDRIMDGSVRGHLARLRTRLAGSR